MDVLRRFVDVVEQVPVHETVVTLRMALREADIFVHVEGNDILETEFSGLDHADQFGIGFNRSGPGAEPEDEGFAGAGRLFADLAGNVMRRPQGALCGIVADNDFHFFI